MKHVYLLILHHVHYDPVSRIDILSDEILKHDKRLHEEILKESCSVLDEQDMTKTYRRMKISDLFKELKHIYT